MKQIVIILIIGLALNACQGSADSSRKNSSDAKTTVQSDPENITTISFDVGGMTCTGCENTVKLSLESLPGVVEAKPSHVTGKTIVQYDKTQVTVQGMETSIESKGYKVKGHSPME